MKNFDTFGVMIDMSRNSVMNLKSLGRFLPLLKKMGYNCVMLYTEDTYEVDGEPYFGYLRGRYSKEEMKALDAFAHSLDMEMIPCIQTLAHLNGFLRWHRVKTDYDDIMLTDDDRTYELIDRMFATLSECFTSRRIHIGMDEAHMLGRGKHLDLHGYETANTLMKRHLSRVCEIAAKYGYEVMVWSDMFFRSWNNGAYYAPKTKLPQEVVDALPKQVIPVYWDYYQQSETAYSDMMENHKQLSKKTWFAGGVWSWMGMIPFNRFSIESQVPALNACLKNRVRNVFMTMWGDDGGECSHFAQLPSLFYLAEYAKGNRDEDSVKRKFRRLVGIDFDEFMHIDCPNDVIPYTGLPRNPSKNILLSDPFCGILDNTVKEGGGEDYRRFAEELSTTSRKSRRYGYLFESAARLCDVMAVKYELGVRTRRAYRAGDRETLRRLAEQDYAVLPRLLARYAEAFEKQWMTDNKPHGFDVQEKRIGALIFRIQSCRKRILNYVNGKIDRIDELEEDILPIRTSGESARFNRALDTMTVNVP